MWGVGERKETPASVQIQTTGLHLVSKFTYQKRLMVRDNAIVVSNLKPLWFNVLKKLSHGILDTYLERFTYFTK